MTDPFAQYDPQQGRRISQLIAGYVQGALTEAEQQELDDWVNEKDENLHLFDKLTDPEKIDEDVALMQSIDTDAALLRVRQKIDAAKPAKRRTVWFAAAAALLVVLLVIYFTQSKEHKAAVDDYAAHDLPPGKSRATLELADGTTILLADGTTNGRLAAGMKMNAEGTLLVDSSSAVQGATLQPLHLLKVPRGGVFRLSLSDGSTVTVNAGSTLAFPGSFDAGPRKVFLSGEAYFEVAKDPVRPFIVSSGNTDITVLGTKFNVNSYEGIYENITTVTEGKVSVASGSTKVVLLPNEAAGVRKTGVIEKYRLDAAQAVAWKNEEFLFRDAPIDQIMQELERWYDASIVYEAKPTDHFNLQISRNERLSKVLKLLEMTGRVRFEVAEKVITVMK